MGTTVADLFRWVVLIMDCFALGTLLALWERIGRFVLPKSAMRLLFVASILFLTSLAAEVWGRFGEPWRWRTVFAALALVFYVAAMLELYRWFATETGRRQRHAAINEFAAFELRRMVDLAKAMEDDPEHMGRYVQPTFLGRLVRRLR